MDPEVDESGGMEQDQEGVESSSSSSSEGEREEGQIESPPISVEINPPSLEPVSPLHPLLQF